MSEELTETERQRLTAWCEGLHAIAGWAEKNPGLVDLFGVDVAIYTLPQYTDLEAARAFAKALPKPVEKVYKESMVDVVGRFGPHRVRYAAWRAEVCERVVVDTVTEKVEVPDPELLARVPTITETRTREIVEWRCDTALLDEGDK